ncbi:MAG: magnesium transporter MgtE N-terminal domain-containing protein [Rectinemataceae bacterium]
MANEILKNGSVRKTWRLQDILGVRVTRHGRKIGRLDDFIFTEEGPIPHISDVLVHRSFGNPQLLVPVDRIVDLGEKALELALDDIAAFEMPHLRENTLLVKDFILYKKVIDMEDREVSMVLDMTILQVNKKFYISEVDFGRRSLYRRLGFLWLADLLSIKDEVVSWSYVQPLPASIGSFRGDVKLKALKEQIEDMPPVDLADIIEELDASQREAVLSQLDTEDASDALEEIDPNVQREILSTMDAATAAKLIGLMTPAQAADVIAVLPYEDKQKIVSRLDEDLREKITAIMDQQDEFIFNYATDRYILLPADRKVGDVEDNYARIAKDKDVAMYIYVEGSEGEVAGVVDIKEILKADESAALRDIMSENIVSLGPTDTLRDAYELFQRYGFRAVPILDETRRILGVIVYKDVMGLKHRFVA